MAGSAVRGVPMVVSAPSGAGKTTLCRELMAREPNVAFSVSYTTRALRGAERHGVDYHFVSDAQFDDLVAKGELLEWAHVHGRRYGTGKQATERELVQGRDILFDIDVQGGCQILQSLPGAVLVFVLPPSFAVLEARLRGRGSDAPEQVARRLAAAKAEIEAARGAYHYWIVNDDLDLAVADLRAVLTAERIRARDVSQVLAGLAQR